MQLALGELDAAFEVTQVPRLQQRVEEHRAKRRRERERDATGDLVGGETLEGVEERQVRLGDRLEEPRLFEERRMLGMAHPRQVRVQHDR